MKVFLFPVLLSIDILSSAFKSGLVSSLAIPHMQKPMGKKETTAAISKWPNNYCLSETLLDLSQSGITINGGSILPAVMESTDPVLMVTGVIKEKQDKNNLGFLGHCLPVHPFQRRQRRAGPRGRWANVIPWLQASL